MHPVKTPKWASERILYEWKTAEMVGRQNYKMGMGLILRSNGTKLLVLNRPTANVALCGHDRLEWWFGAAG